MRVLGIESATSRASVGLVEGDVVLAERNASLPGNHAVTLFSLIQETLEDAGGCFEEIHGLAVSGGPGSFTGLRIGLGVVKGLALAWNLPVVAVPTLDALAASAPREEGLLCVLLDARRGEAYTATFSYGPGGLACVNAPRVVSLEELEEVVPTAARLVGDVVDAKGDLLRERLGEDVRVVRGVFPRGSVVARLGALRLSEGYADDMDRLVPAYLQACTAERKRNAELARQRNEGGKLTQQKGLG